MAYGSRSLIHVYSYPELFQNAFILTALSTLFMTIQLLHSTIHIL
jgi:hypothetical protein